MKTFLKGESTDSIYVYRLCKYIYICLNKKKQKFTKNYFFREAKRNVVIIQGGEKPWR